MSKRVCVICYEPRPRRGTCARCVAIRELLSEIHKQDWYGHTAEQQNDEYEREARLAVHRRRTAVLRGRR